MARQCTRTIAGRSRLGRLRNVLLAAGVAVLITLVLVLVWSDEEPQPDLVPGRVVETTGVLFQQQESGDGTQDSEESGAAALLAEELFRGLPTEGCEPRGPAEEERRSREEFDTLLEQSGVALSKSLEPDFLAAAALLTRDTQERQHLLKRALDMNPGHRVAAWDQLLNCQTNDCDRLSVEAAALAADGANGMIWFLIASDRIKNGQWADADLAMRQMAAAPRISLYFIEYATLVERGLAATTDLDYTERLFAGAGMAAAIAIPGLGDVSGACQSGQNDALVWIDLCREVGQRMSADGEDLLIASFGYGLRAAAAKRAGDVIEAEKIKREGNDRINGLMRDQAETGAQALFSNDPKVLQSYVENYLAHGEIKAMENLVADARRLRADPLYDQCNFVGNADVK